MPETAERAFIERCRAEFVSLMKLASDKAIYEAGRRVSLSHALRTRAFAAVAACDAALQEMSEHPANQTTAGHQNGWDVPDDVRRWMNLLEAVAADILTMTDEEVAEELAALEPMEPSVREIIEQAIARSKTDRKASQQ